MFHTKRIVLITKFVYKIAGKFEFK